MRKYFSSINYLPISIEIEAYWTSARVIVTVREAKVRTSTIVPSTSISICSHLPHGMVAAEKHCFIAKCTNKLFKTIICYLILPVNVHGNI